MLLLNDCFADKACDDGKEFISPRSADYPVRGTKFSEEVYWAVIDVDKDALVADHSLTDKEGLHIAMALQ